MVFNLHTHLILSGVAAFCFTDEDDAVTVRVADADVCGLYGLAILHPVDLWSGFSLQKPNKVHSAAQRCSEYWSLGRSLYQKWHYKVDCFTNSASVRLLQVSGDADLGWF